MRLLLDTHIFLWIATNDPRLSTRARRLISAADERFVSSASIWEAAIKAGLGKLDIDVGELIRAISASGIRELPVRAVHGPRCAICLITIAILSIDCWSRRRDMNPFGL